MGTALLPISENPVLVLEGLNFWKILSSLDSYFAVESNSSSGASPTLPVISAASSFPTTSGGIPPSVSITISNLEKGSGSLELNYPNYLCPSLLMSQSSV